MSASVRIASSLLVAAAAGAAMAAEPGAGRTLVVDPQAQDLAAFADIRSAVAALEEGDRLIIAQGVYREAIDLTKKQWSGSKATVIEGDAAGRTVIKGSVLVSDWVQVAPDVYARSRWDTASQQVFVDGRSLQQIGGEVFGGFPSDADHELHQVQVRGGLWPGRRDGDARTLPPESFYYDAAKQTLTVRTRADLASANVEVSVLTYLLRAEVDELSVRNLIFQHSNTTALSRSGAVTLKGSRLDIEHIAVDDADGVGVLLNGDHIRLADSTICRSGQIGLAARGSFLELVDNEISYGNVRGFSPLWAAGGAKFMGNEGLRDSRIVRHRAFFNHGSGLWFDEGNPNDTLCDSVLAFNDSHGVHFEASGGGRVDGVLAVGNGGRGIYLAGGHDLDLRDNALVGNAMEGIAIVHHGKRSPEGKLLYPAERNRVLGNLIAWNGSSSNERVAVIPPASAGAFADYNIYLSAQPRPGFATGWDGGDGGLDAWQRGSGNDAHSAVVIAPLRAQLRGAAQPGTRIELTTLLHDGIAPWRARRAALREKYPAPELPQACGGEEVSWAIAQELPMSRCAPTAEAAQ